MNAVNYSELRRNLKTYMDQVNDDHTPLIITGKKKVVMISLNDYNSLMETQYLLSSKKNTERLMSSLEKARSGKTFSKPLLEE